MSARVRLTNNVISSKALCLRTPQSQQFSNSFVGYVDSAKNHIPSKLEKELSILFPVIFDSQLLELDDLVTENKYGSFTLQIKLSFTQSCINTERTYGFIQNCVKLISPSFSVPKLSERETITICGMDRVFVSQLVRCPSIRVNLSPSVVSIDIISLRDTFKITSNRVKCVITTNGLTTD